MGLFTVWFFRIFALLNIPSGFMLMQEKFELTK